MICRSARNAIVERSLGALRPEAEAALRAHLGGCAACAEAARNEARLDAALALLTGEPRFRVNVAERVMTALDEMAPPRREPVPGRHLAWAGVAAAVLAFGVLVSGAFLAPSMLGIARGAGRATLETGGFLSLLGRAWIEALSSLKPLLGAAWDLLSAASVFVRTARPLFVGAAAVIVLAMLTMTAAVIGRDLRARIPADRS